MQGNGCGLGPNVSRAVDWKSVGWGLRLQGWPERGRGGLGPTSRRPHAVVESLHNPDALSTTLSHDVRDEKDCSKRLSDMHGCACTKEKQGLLHCLSFANSMCCQHKSMV